MAGPLGERNGMRKRSKRNRYVTEALLAYAIKENFASLKAGMQIVWERVAEGDKDSIAFVRDQLDGKPVSMLEVDLGDEGEEILDQLNALSDMQRIGQIAKMLALARSRGEVIDVTPVTPQALPVVVDDMSDLV
jgi:hypothetical protein